jgi:tetratricopeptide (TPR) repeat protein
MIRTAFSLLFVALFVGWAPAQDPSAALEAAQRSYDAYLGFSGDEAKASSAADTFTEYFSEAKGRSVAADITDAVKKRDRFSELLLKEKGADAGFIGRAKDISLANAAEQIGKATEDRRLAGRATTWILKGGIYTGIAERLLDPDADPEKFAPFITGIDAEITAVESLQRAIKEASPGPDKQSALRGMFDLQPTLGKLGTRYFEAKNVSKAKRNFDLMFELHDLLGKERVTSFLTDKNNNSLAQYYRAKIELDTGKQSDGRKILEKLYKDGFPEAGVYETLYSLVLKEKNKEAAYPYLEKGRKILPEDSSLLILEINHMQSIGKSASTLDALKTAIQKQPNNDTLRSALGNAYDKLYLQEANGGDRQKAQEYFDQAVDFYKQAVEIEPRNYPAIFGLGAIYFNNAAVVAQDLKQYENNPDPEITAKFDAVLRKVYSQFDMALPYLQKAESIDPNEPKTLNALMQVYDRKGEPGLAGEFRRRLAKVQSGGKNEKSYFDR